MPTAKIAITIPEDMLKIIDKRAKKRHLPRSRVITNLLRNKLEAEEKDRLTQLTDDVFSDQNLITEQKKTAESFLNISSLPEEEY